MNKGQTVVVSRRTDPSPVKCLDCGWVGRQMDCIHTYIGIGHGDEADVDPIERCPVCGGMNQRPSHA